MGSALAQYGHWKSENAPITIVEFSDFQCPFCVRARPTVNRVRETYGDRVRFVFRHFPLDFHAQAEKAGEAYGAPEIRDLSAVLVGLNNRITIQPIIEHPKSLKIAPELMQYPTVKHVVFGIHDFSKAMGIHITPRHWTEELKFYLHDILFEARIAGKGVIGGAGEPMTWAGWRMAPARPRKSSNRLPGSGISASANRCACFSSLSQGSCGAL